MTINREKIEQNLRDILEAYKVYGVSCDSYRDCIEKAVKKGIISEDVGIPIKGLVSLRNLLIHPYWEINDTKVYQETNKNKKYI